MKDIRPLVGIVLLLVVGGAVYALLPRPQRATFPTPSSVDVNSDGDSDGVLNTGSDQEFTSSAQPFLPAGTDSRTMQLDGTPFQDASGLYAFLYPSDYTVDSQESEQHTRLVKRAETARPQSELSDGALVVFESVALQGSSLEAWVDAQLKAQTENGMAEVVQPKRAITLGEYPGFTYELGGYGGATHVVVQKDAQSDSAVHISFVVSDPQELGYRAEVEGILSTLELMK